MTRVNVEPKDSYRFSADLIGRWGQFILTSNWLLAAVMFLLALGPRTLNLGVFVGPDEFSWVTRSAEFAQALADGDLTRTYQTGHPGVTLMWIETVASWLRYGVQWSLTGGADWSEAVGFAKTMEVLAAKRQAVGVANALAVMLTVLLVRQLFGCAIAWLAGFLLVFDPFLLTETRALRTEGVVTSLNMLALAALLLYIKEPRLWVSVLTGILTGLALLSKVSAAVLLPLGLLVLVGVTLADRTRPPAPRWRAGLLAVVAWAGSLLLTLILLWPALWVAPLEVFQRLTEYVALRAVDGEGGGSGTFFMGRPVNYAELGGWFYPVALLYRTGPWVWLGLLSLIALASTRQSRAQLVANLDDTSGSAGSYVPAALAIMLFYLIIYLVLITRSELKYDRYLIPMLPVLDVLAAIGLVAGWRWLAARISWLRRWGWTLALFVLISQMALTWPHHPYYYTYWNPLLGGLRQAVHVLPVGDGEGIDRIAANLNALPKADQIKLASANSQKVRPLFKGEEIPLANLDGRWVQGDYVMIYISQLQRGKHDPHILEYLGRHKPLQTVTLKGLDYAWLYPGPAAHYYGGGHTLEGRGTLYGYDLEKTEVAAGDPLTVTLYWRNEGQRETDRFFVRLMDLDGYVWTETMVRPRPGFEQAARTANAIVEGEAELELPVGMPPGDYFLKPGFRTAEGQIIGYFELPGDTRPLKVTTAAAYPALGGLQPPQPVRMTANQDLALLGYKLDPDALSAGSEIWLTLYWQALTEPAHDYVILIRLLDRQGEELAYWLGRPVRSGYPTPAWQAGQVVQDPWLLTIPVEAQPGLYQLEIALFDAASQTEVSRQEVGQVAIK